MLRRVAPVLLAALAVVAGNAEVCAQIQIPRGLAIQASQTPSPQGPPTQVAPAPTARKIMVGRSRVATPVAAARPTSARPTQQPRPSDSQDRAARTLSFFNTHTRESITITYRRDGVYLKPALERLNRFLRDSVNGTQIALDPRLFDILWLVRQRLQSTAPFHVISSYRSPSTNAWLASYTSGVASDSLHMRGQAIDVMLPGRTVGQLHAAGLTLSMGGVGYYPRTGFVHFDTGPVRYW